jgi:hypothetical protein
MDCASKTLTFFELIQSDHKTIITLKKKIVSGLNVVVVYDLLICLAWLRSGITHSFEIAL